MTKKQTKKSSARKAEGRKAPVAISRTRVLGAPKITMTGTSARIKHREYFMDVTVPADTGFEFHVEALPINPGFAATFPWLHDIANRWEMYRFHKLAFEFIPSCPSTTNGRVAMAIDFDALDGVPEDKVQLNSYAGVQACSVWDGMKMVVPPVRLGLGMPQRYTRRGQHVDLDLKTYDLGNFIWATYDVVPGATVPGVTIPVGELWVEYEVELLIPQTRIVTPSVSFKDAAGPGVGETTVLAAPVQTGAGVLQLLAPGQVGFDGSETRLKVLDSFKGILSLCTKGNTGLAAVAGNLLTAGASSMSDMYQQGSSTMYAKDWLVDLKRNAVIRLTKTAAVGLGSTLLYMTAVDPASIHEMLGF